MPSPPMNRQTAKSITSKASPAPMDEITNKMAPVNITRGRPQRSASPPANQAPTAQPISATATTSPETKELNA